MPTNPSGKKQIKVLSTRVKHFVFVGARISQMPRKQSLKQAIYSTSYRQVGSAHSILVPINDAHLQFHAAHPVSIS